MDTEGYRRIKGYKDTGIKRYKETRINRNKDKRVQGFKNKIEYKGTRIQFNTRIQGYD